MKLFRQDSNWLIRYSILAAIDFTDYPEVLLEFCTLGLRGDNLFVKQTAIASLEQLAETPQESIALDLLLCCANSEQGTIRAQVARVLKHFDDPRAQTALINLRQDSNYRVVGATLEGLI